MIIFNREELNSTICVQQNLMKILFYHIEKMICSINTNDPDYSSEILKLLEKSKQALKSCNENMNIINTLIRDYNSLSENFQNNYNNNILKINNNTIIIENYIYMSLHFFELSLPLSTSNVTDNNRLKETKTHFNENNNSKFRENCLIISETTKNIILPHYIDDLKNINIKNKTYEQIIQENYTLPIDLFKPAFVSRFREAFKLAHYKEKKSIAFSLNLATELMFNYNLHPAIITACRNLDELDIYLDCLENNETEKFKCFDIIFEIPPIISKKAL